ncbi:MAG: protein kinase [Deltaproteobacteria bacterium]|nr:protein kinase [Deltaproteobacteria bacterium]
MPVPSIGDRFANKYVVEAELGHGGMGVVLAARHEQLQQRVAIKFLLEGAACGQEARERFLREARAACMIDDSHVVRVFDVGETQDGGLYMVMEHLQGTDLRKATESRLPIATQEAVGYALQACVGLAKAHAAGIVHRDLKPGNLFLCARQNLPPLVKVLDFGISKLRGDGQALTQAEAVLGTPSYMAPEQQRSTRDVDARADIWSMGAILYKMLTGRTPYTGTFANRLLESAAGPPPAIRSLRADLPNALAAIIDTLLLPDPAQRPADALQVARALAAFDPQTAAAEGLSAAPLVAAASTGAPSARSAATTVDRPQPQRSPPGMQPTQLSAGGAPPQARAGDPTAEPAHSSRVQVVSVAQPAPQQQQPPREIPLAHAPAAAYAAHPPMPVSVASPGVSRSPPAPARPRWPRRLAIGVAIVLPVVLLATIGLFVLITHWIKGRLPSQMQTVALPRGIDPSRVDALDALPLVRAEALKRNPTAKLAQILVLGDAKGGIANLTRGDSVSYFFSSSAPSNADPWGKCMTLALDLRDSGMHLACFDKQQLDPTSQEPLCGPAKVWAAASALSGAKKVRGIMYGPGPGSSWKVNVERTSGSTRLKLSPSTCAALP